MGNERKRLEYKIFSALFARGEICDGASLPYKNTAKQAMRAIGEIASPARRSG
jgi:hypothetical protein